MKVALIKLTIELTSPGGVVDPQHASEDLDLPIARDPRYTDETRYAVPPTSIAGLLRRIPGMNSRDLFGYVVPKTEIGAPSRIRVRHSDVRLPNARVELRARNAMDRRRGAPRANHLFVAEQLPAGTAIDILLDWRDAADQELTAFVRALRKWQGQLGRGASTGAGSFRTVAVGARILDLGKREDLVLWLDTPGPDLYTGIRTDSGKGSDSTEPLLEVRWRVADALHVGAGQSVDDERTVARIARTGEVPAVPGTTWKGVLRARCEYILRSIGVDACEDGSCASCPTCTVFGHSARRTLRDESAVAGRRSRIMFASSKIGPDPTQTLGDVAVTNRPHVAIDRFTGGAAPGLLYTAEVVTSGVVTLRVDSIADPPRWARGLLLAAVRDIGDGLVGIGGGTTRGNGTLERIGTDGKSVTDDEMAEIREALAAVRDSADK